MCRRPQQLRVMRLSSDGGCVVLDIVTRGVCDDGEGGDESEKTAWLSVRHCFFVSTMRRG
jgi:hypothetical protein